MVRSPVIACSRLFPQGHPATMVQLVTIDAMVISLPGQICNQAIPLLSSGGMDQLQAGG
jgi:hypothetical protein